MKPRWQQRPPGSNWGEFGPDDQRGRMNLVTREKVLQGVAEVKEGITFCLSLPLDYPGGSVLNPRRSPPRLAATLRGGKQNFCFPLAAENPDFTDVISDDLVLLTLQYSTQWDSFAHIGSRFDADGDGEREIVFYNGFRAGADVRPAPENASAEPWAKYEGTQARALGIENLAEHGAQGRGVMIDLHHHFARRRHAVTYDELMQVLDQDKVEIEKGDMVCLYTGFADVILELKKNPDPKLLRRCTSTVSSRTASISASCGTSPGWRAGCASMGATAFSSLRRRCGCPAPSARPPRRSPRSEFVRLRRRRGRVRGLRPRQSPH